LIEMGSDISAIGRSKCVTMRHKRPAVPGSTAMRQVDEEYSEASFKAGLKELFATSLRSGTRLP
jgi:hypothetical protein